MRAARRWWRWLTSMRTALVLLFALAVAAVPGSVLPQRNLNIEQVNAYLVRNPKLGPWLDRLWGFDVYASPWFAAVYLLLFVSLVGCVLPRLREHYTALRRPPPEAPAKLERLPKHAEFTVEGDAVAHVRAVLRGFRVVVRRHSTTVTISAEKGYLKETGNLVFHLSLIGVLIGVALGSWYGWHANRLIVAGPEGEFCNTLQQYDDYGLGARVKDTDLPPFCLRLEGFRASYLTNGQPVSYAADLVRTPGGSRHNVEVNAPLRLKGANVYLLGHGYAPIVRYTDKYGRSQTTTAPFLPADEMLTSEGVALFPDANVDPKTGARGPQVAFSGVYVPTVPTSGPKAMSLHPEERDPGLMLTPYRGNLGLDAGIPQSVYKLDSRQIKSGQLARVGQPMLLRKNVPTKLDDGTTVEFLGTRDWVTVSIRHDPGELLVLGSAVLLLLGLLAVLMGRRRRVWFRLTPTAEGTAIVAGGLPRTEQPAFAAEFDSLVARARKD